MRALLASLLLVTACAGTATYSATATVDTPELVEVEPGVQVIYDYDEPVFYSDNYYWRNDGGRWYRSSYHNRGWVAYEAPSRVRTVSVRANYRHYKPAGYQPRSSRGRAYQPQPSRPAGYQPQPSRPAGYQPAPSRDHDRDHDKRDHDKHDDKRDHDKRDKDDKHDRKDRDRHD